MRPSQYSYETGEHRTYLLTTISRRQLLALAVAGFVTACSPAPQMISGTSTPITPGITPTSTPENGSLVSNPFASGRNSSAFERSVGLPAPTRV